jgi:hypothetical protein
MSLLEDVAFLKQAHQGLQPELQPSRSEPLNRSAKTNTEKKQSNVTVGSSPSELQVVENNLVVPEQESNCEAEESATNELSELLSKLPRELDLFALIKLGENTEELTSELPESKTEPPEADSQLIKHDNSSTKLDSESLDELLLVESNNHGMTSANSESPDDLLSSSPNADESKDSLTAALHLTGAALARRLNVSPSTLRHKNNARNFRQWALGHDPDVSPGILMVKNLSPHTAVKK